MTDFISPFTDEHLQTLMGVGMIIWILIGIVRLVQVFIPKPKQTKDQDL